MTPPPYPPYPPYPYGPPPPQRPVSPWRAMPKALKTAQVLLFVILGVFLLSLLPGLLVALFGGMHMQELGMLLYWFLPAPLVLAAALRLPRGGWVLFWSLLALMAWLVIDFLRGANMLIPIPFPVAVVVCLLWSSSRRFFGLPRAQRGAPPHYAGPA